MLLQHETEFREVIPTALGGLGRVLQPLLNVGPEWRFWLSGVSLAVEARVCADWCYGCRYPAALHSCRLGEICCGHRLRTFEITLGIKNHILALIA